MTSEPPDLLKLRYRAILLAIVVCCALAGSALAAHAQTWRWPWEEDEPRPRPRPAEPMYPDERGPPPQQPPSGGYDAPPPRDDYSSRGAAPEPEPSGQPGNWSPRPQASICLQLEQRLVQDGQRGTQARDLLPQLDAQVRDADRAARTAQDQLERRDCYDYFLFSKTLRRTRQCVDLSNQYEDARRQLSQLEAQRQDILSSGGRNYQDDIIRELARNNCGGSYAAEARKRDRAPFSSFWEDDESEGAAYGNQYGALPYATYRTLCVRMCDGYYFPVSFSTLQNHFERDAGVCQSKCAAPAELYYHQNPGGSVDQMVGARTQELYTKLKSAFRYRKEFVNGCSCKAEEYVAQEGPPDEYKAVPKQAASPASELPQPGAPAPKPAPPPSGKAPAKEAALSPGAADQRQ